MSHRRPTDCGALPLISGGDEREIGKLPTRKVLNLIRLEKLNLSKLRHKGYQ